MKNLKGQTYTYAVITEDGHIEPHRTKSIRRFLRNTRSIKFKDGVKTVYLKVVYGKGVDVFGKPTLFQNEGEYNNQEDLMAAALAFTEFSQS